MKESDHRKDPFEQIVRETKKTVLSAICRHLYPLYHHAIDDVAQETYYRAYRHLIQGRFREEAKRETWLYQIARNESLRMNQKLIVEEIKSKLLAENEIHTSPEESEKILFLDTIYQLVSRLPEKYRCVIELYLKGHPEKEIAQKLGLLGRTVRIRKFRAVLKLACLANKGGQLEYP